jgi:ATP-binding protein involved in chromosome partitioning
MGLFSRNKPNDEPRPPADGAGGGPTKEAVLQALRQVMEPELHRDIVSLNMVKSVAVCDGIVKVGVELTTPACPLKKEITESVEKAVAPLPGVRQVTVEMTSNVKAVGGGPPRGMAPGVKNILAVSSGKGGVGKSTVAVNLTAALAGTGARVGVLDCDLYGPNVPTMLGIPADHKPEVRDGRLQPVAKHGFLSMSIGYLMDPDQPIVWRGPMLHKAIQQFLSDVEWGDLDYLVVDLPPGTGDAQLSLAQLVPLAGAVVVTTPQEVSVVDVRKAIAMFRQVHVDVLGVVENMSAFVCPHCRHETKIFGEGGAEGLAKKFGIPVLGRIPLETDVRAGGDTGVPIAIGKPDSAVAAAFREVAGKVAAALSVKSAWALPILQ